MSWHGGAAGRKWGDNWPFISHEYQSTAHWGAWHAYLGEHLGGLPRTYQLFLDGKITHWNAPEAEPWLFDLTYHPDPRRRFPTPRPVWHSESIEVRAAVTERILGALRTATNASPPAESYPAMFAKHGRPIGPFELGRCIAYGDADILPPEPKQKDWVRFTDAELREIYTPQAPPPDTPPQPKAPRARFRVIDDCSPNAVCLVCQRADGKVQRIKDGHAPGSQSETLHLACAPEFFLD